MWMRTVQQECRIKIRSPRRSSHPPQGSPQMLRPVLGGRVWAEWWLELERPLGIQKPWQLARGKRFLARFPCVRRGEMYPAGRRDACRGKIPYAGRQGAGGPWSWAVQKALVGRCRASAIELTPAGASGHGRPTRGTPSVQEPGGRAAVVLCLVEGCSAALSVLENCSRNFSEGSSEHSLSLLLCWRR
jgi:hypothetical protein